MTGAISSGSKFVLFFFALVYELVLCGGCSAFQCSAGCEMLLFFLISSLLVCYCCYFCKCKRGLVCRVGGPFAILRDSREMRDGSALF